jgi:hypothetical protein
VLFKFLKKKPKKVVEKILNHQKIKSKPFFIETLAIFQNIWDKTILPETVEKN